MDLITLKQRQEDHHLHLKESSIEYIINLNYKSM